MPKTKSTYINQIKFNASDKMLMLISNARRSKGAKNGFGVVPSQTEFLRGVIYYWVRKNAPEMLDMNGEIPEVLEHKALKENHKAELKKTQDFVEEYFKNRKK